MIERTISAGGRFYLAKDHFMTGAQYRRSMGDSTIEEFLQLKRRLDPDGVWQSDLYRRLFV
jgi:FAD/FMN-containing dehydrogenase